MRGFIKIGVVSALAGTMLIAVSDASLGQNLTDADALTKTVDELYGAGKYAEAIPFAQRALAIREKALGPDHPDVAELLDNLGLLYTGQARYADAEPLYKRSLVITEKSIGSHSC